MKNSNHNKNSTSPTSPESPTQPPLSSSTLPHEINLIKNSPSTVSAISEATITPPGETLQNHHHNHHVEPMALFKNTSKQKQKQQQHRRGGDDTTPLLPPLGEEEYEEDTTADLNDEDSGFGSSVLRGLRSLKRGGGGVGAGNATETRAVSLLPRSITNMMVNNNNDNVPYFERRQSIIKGEINASSSPKKKKKGSFFSRTEQFRKLSDWAFDVVDADGSGSVDKKELYSGLLLIHLNLATYAGPAACKPVSREYVEEVFDKMDHDNSNTLSREEFHDVMTVLCSQVFTRVIIQWSMTLLIVPIVAQFLLDWGTSAFQTLFRYWTVFVMDEEMMINAHDRIWTWMISRMSYLIDSIAVGGVLGKLGSEGILGFMGGYVGWMVDVSRRGLEMVPESVWETIPVTLMSCVLGILIVPYMIFKIDDYHQSLASHTAEVKKKEREE